MSSGKTNLVSRQLAESQLSVSQVLVASPRYVDLNLSKKKSILQL